MKKSNLTELTVRSVILGVVLSIILAAANAYLGLFAGMTVSASIPAAVISMGILRLLKKGNVLENNIVQTAASAGESVAAGVIFTLPALVMMGFWEDFNYLWVTLIAGFGGILGVLFTIPLRRSLIIEEKLQFPEGVATAEVLETGQEGGEGVWIIAKAAAVGALFKLGAGKLLGLFPEVLEGAKTAGSSVFYFGSNLSPALLSVGYIVGLNIAVLIFLGGAFNWYIAVPLVSHNLGGCPEGTSALDWSYQLWSEHTRYLGVGAMLIGGLWTIFQMRKSLLGGIMGGLRAYKNVTGSGEKTEIDRCEQDIPMKWVLVSLVASIAPLFLVYQVFVQQVHISLVMSLIMLVTGFVFSAVAGYMAGLVGSSNNPISGVTISTVLVSSLLLLVLMGADAENGPAAAIIIGSVVCCAAAIAGDNMQDLKAGHIVGSTPWKQQFMQIVGVVAGALVMAPVLGLLNQAYGFQGTANAGPDALACPQASLMKAVAEGVFKSNLPWNYISIGAAVAVFVIILDLMQQKKGSSFRLPVLAVAIGIYLPFELSVPILIGGLVHWFIKRVQRDRSFSSEGVVESDRRGLLFASGLITGEALMGILMAIPIVTMLKVYEVPKNAFPLLKMDGESSFLPSLWSRANEQAANFNGSVVAEVLGTALLVVVVIWMIKVTLKIGGSK